VELRHDRPQRGPADSPIFFFAQIDSIQSSE
jgi:hypothetical protein